MVDRLRTYRNWRRRRLALLLPVLAGAVATQLWLAGGSTAPAWLRVVSLGASGLILVLVGFVLAQTLICDRLHARGDRAGARLLREQLAPSGRAALCAAVLLAILNIVPYLIPMTPSATSRPVSRRSHLPTAPGRPAPMSLSGPEFSLSLPDVDFASVPPPAPDVRPIVEGLPATLTLADAGSSPDVPAVLAFLQASTPEQGRPGGGTDEDGLPRYRPDVENGFQLVADERVTMTFERLGVPNEGAPEEWLPPELRLEVTLLEGRGRGTEFTLVLDVPIGKYESIRTSIAVARLSGEQFLDESATDSWQRVTIAYTLRLAGFTRHAPVDLSFSLGMSADRYRMEDLNDGARLSPHVALDATVWQQGSVGLTLHAAYAIPVNMTGGSAGVLDLSATLRIDLSDNVTLHAGYRYVALQLRDYENALLGSRARAESSEHFTGPIFGIDIRF